MSTGFLLAGLALILVVLSVVYKLLDRRMDKPSQDYYLDGLHAMVEGDFRSAAHSFRRAVEADSDNVQAYEKLGHVYRELGDYARATKIHRELTIRGGLRSEDRARIFLSLCDDLMLSDKADEAQQAAEKAVQEDKRNIKAHFSLLDIHQGAGRWEAALASLKRIESLGNKEMKTRRALITVELARETMAAGKSRAGRVMLKDALKDDAHCVSALLLMGDSYRDEHRVDEAVKYWQIIPFEIPDHGWQVFERIESVYFEKGRFGEVEALYRRMIHSSPANPDAWVYLARFYERKGELEHAISLCRDGLEKTDGCIDVARMMVRLLGRKGDSRELITFTTKLVDRLMEDAHQDRLKKLAPLALKAGQQPESKS